jgi:hypothetical protein
MCGAAEVLGFDTSEGSRTDTWAVVEETRVRDQGDVDGLVGASVEELDLTAVPTFFSWGAEKDNFSGELVFGDDFSGRQSCGNGRCSDEVVAASVPYAGKRVCYVSTMSL